MARKARQRISYVLPLTNSPAGHRPGHRLGINGLAIDSHHSILYSGGRDGSICAWDLNLDLKRLTPLDNPFESPDDPPAGISKRQATTFRAQTQAHTHWVNDIVLAQANTALVSASSDLTVKVWRPWSEESQPPQTIGQHADYVKCLATPGPQAAWVASGCFNRRICLWDLNGGGKELEIQVGDEDKSEKGSVYALSVGRNIVASGGPESIVRLWDSRTGKIITKFVGHTDNVRDILINETGDLIMTASSDQTVKAWSVTAGRCMHTLTMHNDSVWSLFSDDPQLGIFYSSDRSGLVVKTDVRGTFGEMDDGLSLAVAQENEGVNRLIACGDYIWTATSSSSINRWADIDTGAEIQLPEPFRMNRASSLSSKQISPPATKGHSKVVIPPKSILRISNTARYPAAAGREADTLALSLNGGRKDAEIILDPDLGAIIPVQNLPLETIEGQHGFIKHKLMNDRRRALTLDTAGEVLLWDLLRCVPIRSFGKRHLDDVEPEINTKEAIAPWCSVDTRTGRLAVVLEEYNCFDAEMYADELQLNEAVEFREDQRINLGKRVLRYLFAKLIDQMIKRDEAFRAEINAAVRTRHSQRSNEPISIQIPSSPIKSWQEAQSSALTPRANGTHHTPMTPGLNIGVATPGAVAHLPGVPEDGAALNKQTSQGSRTSGDYFSNVSVATPETLSRSATTPGEAPHELPKSPSDPDKENGKDSSTIFGKKFRMGMSFGSKKSGRSASLNTDKPVVVEGKTEDGSESSENGDYPRQTDNNLLGVMQRIRNEYNRAILEDPQREVESGITPSLPNETPVLKIPPMTTVIIQEETSGGSADLYRGTVDSVGEDARLIEERAPMWLGELLLRNKIPYREPIKVSFILQSWQDLLPSIAGSDGNSRLNANRMLRVKKILAYVAERIEPPLEQDDPDALRPEDYLELYCYDQKLPTTMTLATLRAHVWKGGPDVVLYYKSNGRKLIQQEIPLETVREGLSPVSTSTTATSHRS